VIVATAVAQSSRRGSTCPAGGSRRASPSGTATRSTSARSRPAPSLRVDARTAHPRLVAGRTARGDRPEGAQRRLFVAGAGTGRAWVYTRAHGRQLAAFRLAPSGADTFINDVVGHGAGAYFTTRGATRSSTASRSTSEAAHDDLTGIPLQAGNNLNGIVATPDGRTLCRVQTNAGRLWRINPQTGAATADRPRRRAGRQRRRPAAVGPHALRRAQPRQPDRRRDLSSDLSRGLTRTIRSRNFDVPTTVARIGDRLYAVNARFGTTGRRRRPTGSRASPARATGATAVSEDGRPASGRSDAGAVAQLGERLGAGARAAGRAARGSSRRRRRRS
jgi:hypothetical protein